MGISGGNMNRPFTEKELTEEIVCTMLVAETPPQLIYAFMKTGLILKEDSPATPEDKAEYQAAVQEFFDRSA